MAGIKVTSTRGKPKTQTKTRGKTPPTSPCKQHPAGDMEATRHFRAPMTARDKRRCEIFARELDAWKRNLAAWEAFINGAAPYWAGPRPRRPGPPPMPPSEGSMTNTARRRALRIGEAKIFRDLKTALAEEFSCSGRCASGPCKQKFSRKRGRGADLIGHTMWIDYTVVGRCDCP